MQSLRREVNVLSAFKHPHIVRLIGYSVPDDALYSAGGSDGAVSPSSSDFCLVYEFLACGDLSYHLLDDGRAAMVSGAMRIRIACGVAKALNYMHCHKTGFPAFHRDVKAANIALSVDRTAKLIDCGLSKYIAPDGKGNSMMSMADQRFGTAGYMCNRYVQDGKYSEKSEVFSFGIVLLELITGRVQMQGDDESRTNLYSRFVEEEEDLVASCDRRVEWEADCLASMAELALNCTKTFPKRISSMSVIVQRLMELEGRTSGRTDVTAAVVAVSKIRCLVCFDAYVASDGIACKSESHFLCHSCFSGEVCEQSASEQRGAFSANGCNVVCRTCTPGPGGRFVFGLKDLAANCSEEAMQVFLSVRDHVAEAKIVREEEEKFAVRLEAMRRENLQTGRAEELRRHCNHIAEHILTLKCPNAACRMVFGMERDFSSCFALKCDHCKNQVLLFFSIVYIFVHFKSMTCG